MISGLALAPDVHAVIADERAVFLDVRKDRYFKLGISQTELLALGASPARENLVSQLIRRGLLRGGGDAGDDGARAVRERTLTRHRGSNVFGVVGACQWAAATLRSRRLADIVQWARVVRITDRNADRALASRFLAGRPFYPRDYNCLFDSLALTRFLRLRGVAGDWVFGVRGAPFAAHCWVEMEGEPVNDEAGFVAPYTPILVL